MTKKVLTLTDLLKDKEKYAVKQEVLEEIYVERLKANIIVRKPERALCLEVLNMVRDEKQSDKADAYMVYNIVVEPNLKDAELHKAFGVKDPLEIVEKIFEPGEIAQISEIGLELAGYKKGTVSVIKDLKN